MLLDAKPIAPVQRHRFETKPDEFLDCVTRGIYLLRHEGKPIVALLSLPESNYNFSVKLLFDYLSLSLVILAFGLCGTIGAFATRYMHREPGFNRFFVLYAMFLLGMVLSALAGTIETLFTGCLCTSGGVTGLPVARSHTRAVPSWLAVATRRPSGLKAKSVSGASWASSARRRPLAMSQTRSTPLPGGAVNG